LARLPGQVLAFYEVAVVKPGIRFRKGSRLAAFVGAGHRSLTPAKRGTSGANGD